MNIHQLKPRKALNKAFLKAKPNRIEIELFKTNLTQLIKGTNDNESEEFHKNLVSDFLKETYYKPDYFINTKGRTDLVIHTAEKAESPVGVVIETKKPTNKSEMLTKNNINVKAFHELVLYYLRERILNKNTEIKHIIATNINEWFVFDSNVFEKLFAENKKLVKQFEDFEAGRLSGTKTDFFYTQIAAPFVESIAAEIEFTHFDIRDYEKPLLNNDKKDDNKLIALFKLLSPEHLLKLPFTNDSNSLDRRFYSELLHIIGLTERNEKGKKYIERAPEEKRNTGSILENAIIQLDSLDKISRLEKPSQFGENLPERLFNVALELSITWINRVLFLKLMEGQLVTYHKGDKSYEFLNSDKISNYDDLNSLFFQVLARKQSERNEDIKDTFDKIPYLNSSLFEPTNIEHTTLFISNLRDDKEIPLYAQTILKNSSGKKLTGKLTTLDYLFRFLSAYDFASEGSEEIQEENKTIINASVLGLIFEKINGYKDGSFFTPGFITMYMARETIRKAVVQKFNDAKGWNCQNLDDLYNKIDNAGEANKIINQLKICDPAVGSGHFLVSALNEILAIKHDLNILQDRNNRRLKEYNFEVVNDELIVTDEDGELFEYNPKNAETQRVQETLFHEKQTLIESCLFGVDINPNSVKICRLRLWIELLKNAYYKNETELETLPNIDINIKCGNSLISRFPLDADLKQALNKSKWTIDSYRIAVDTYRNAENKEQKQEMQQLIDDIKSNFRSEISQNDPKVQRLRKLSGEIYNLTNQGELFELSKAEKSKWQKKMDKLTKDKTKLEAEIEAIKSNKIYENAFEWRFEFPEVLDDNGDFIGFDVVIGNPPYIRQEMFSDLKPYLQLNYEIYNGTADLYVYFIERSLSVLRDRGEFVFIVPNKWLRAGYGKNLRPFIKKQAIENILDFGDLPVFEEATTYPLILHLSKNTPKDTFMAINVETLKFENSLKQYAENNKISVLVKGLNDKGWSLNDVKIQKLLMKIFAQGTTLQEYTNGDIFYGIKTGLNEAFVIDEATRSKLIQEDPKSEEIIKPFVGGKDIKHFRKPNIKKYLILFENGITHNLFGSLSENAAKIKIQNKYPAIFEHLLNFETKAKKRYDKGRFWWELRACDYYHHFEKEKIIYPNICKRPEFTFDDNNSYTNQKCFIITQFNKEILGVLNSKVFFFLFKSLLPKLRGDFFEPGYMYLKDFPVVEDNSGQMLDLVEEVFSIKTNNPTSSIAALESQIDQLVYELYGLTDEEIQIVEAGVK